MSDRDIANDARLATLGLSLEARTADLRALAARLAPQAHSAKGHVNGTGPHPDELGAAVSMLADLAAAQEALARCVEERHDYKVACLDEIYRRLGDDPLPDFAVLEEELRGGRRPSFGDLIRRLPRS